MQIKTYLVETQIKNIEIKIKSEIRIQISAPNSQLIH